MNQKRGDLALTTLISVVIAIMIAFTFTGLLTKGCQNLTVRSQDTIKQMAGALDNLEPGQTQSYSYELDVGAMVVAFPPQTDIITKTIINDVQTTYSAAGVGAPGTPTTTRKEIIASFHRPQTCPSQESCLCLSLEYLDKTSDEIFDSAEQVTRGTRTIDVKNNYYCHTLKARLYNPTSMTNELHYTGYRANQNQLRSNTIYATRQGIQIQGTTTNIIVLCDSAPGCWNDIRIPTQDLHYQQGDQIIFYDNPGDLEFKPDGTSPIVPSDYLLRPAYTRQRIIITETFTNIFSSGTYGLLRIQEQYRQQAPAQQEIWIQIAQTTSDQDANEFNRLVDIARRDTNIIVQEIRQ